MCHPVSKTSYFKSISHLLYNHVTLSYSGIAVKIAVKFAFLILFHSYVFSFAQSKSYLRQLQSKINSRVSEQLISCSDTTLLFLLIPFSFSFPPCSGFSSVAGYFFPSFLLDLLLILFQQVFSLFQIL